MKSRVTPEHGIARRLTAAVIVAIGVAIVWGVTIGWGVAIYETWTDSGNSIYENVSVMRDGTPVIQTYSTTNYQDISYRTLEGEPIDPKFDIRAGGQLMGAYLPPAVKPPRFFNWPMGWGQSLAATDNSRPLSSWYLIRDSEPNGHAYFAGFDAYARQPIGFIGRRGFRRSLPPRDEWFNVGLYDMSYNMRAASTQSLAYDGPSSFNDFVMDGANIPPWLVFVIDGDRVQEVDLRARSVREVFTGKELVSVGILWEADERDPRDDPQTSYHVAVRSYDRIYVLDPAKGTSRAFRLPETLKQESPQVYSIGTEQILLTWSTHRGEERQMEHVAWVDLEGKIVREETFQLSQFAQLAASSNSRDSAMQMPAVLPVPLAWAAMTGIMPVSQLQSNNLPTFADAFAWTLDMFWPALIVATLIGCFSAWLVWRWQRKSFRSHTGAWCGFAFLLGLPAVAAYWLEMRHAKLEACGECKVIVPRDRDACASCATPFPAPPLVGTELFA